MNGHNVRIAFQKPLKQIVLRIQPSELMSSFNDEKSGAFPKMRNKTRMSAVTTLMSIQHCLGGSSQGS